MYFQTEFDPPTNAIHFQKMTFRKGIPPGLTWLSRKSLSQQQQSRGKEAGPEQEKRRARRVTFRYMSETLSEDKSLNPAIDFPAITVHKKPECISEAVERTQFVAE